jgi:hypothetical protein
VIARKAIIRNFNPTLREFYGLAVFKNMAKKETRKEEFKIAGTELLKKVKELVAEGNVRRIIIKKEDGEILIEVPLTVAVVGTVFAPALAAIGALAAFLTSCTLIVERKD